MALVWPAKDPDEVLDYDIDWTPRLDGDSVSTSVFTVASGTVVVDSNEISGAITKAWLSGGTLGERCLITNQIITAAGRTMEQSVKLQIKAK